MKRILLHYVVHIDYLIKTHVGLSDGNTAPANIFFGLAGSVTTRLHAYDETRSERTTQPYRQVIGKCHSKPQMKYSLECARGAMYNLIDHCVLPLSVLFWFIHVLCRIDAVITV